MRSGDFAMDQHIELNWTGERLSVDKIRRMAFTILILALTETLLLLSANVPVAKQALRALVVSNERAFLRGEPGAAAQDQQLSFSFADPVGDQTGRIDVKSMVMVFDSTTGAYSINLIATPANPFIGMFRVNINLLNPDTNNNDAFFQDNVNDFDLTSATTVLTLTGASTKLQSWRAGNRVATNSGPFGTPPGSPPESTFLCNVLDIPFGAAKGDSIADSPGVFANIVRGTDGADVAITNTDSPDPVATGARLSYTISITNRGPGVATDVAVNDTLPNDTTLVSVVTSQGTVIAPPVGASGQIIATLGILGSGGSATITIGVNVLAVPGSTLSNTATVSSPTSDPIPTNNSSTATTLIQGGGIVLLSWEQPPPTAANPTPAPINLTVQPGGAASTTMVSSETAISPADAPCTLIQVNIYKADALPVTTIPANLWKSVPPTQLATTMAAAPGGSFYVITNVWQCGDTTVESGGSNQAGVPAGPTINRMKVGGKIKAIGEGFTDPADIFLDGVGFKKPAAFRDSTLIVQKGALTDGRFIGDVVTPGKTVVISVRNSNGGISSIAFISQ
jgi:uncharacterized repeat protein (TIGR01451 family)